MLDIVLAVVMFTGVVLAAGGGAAGRAHASWSPRGDVSIIVNDDASKTLRVAAGGTLLGALADNKIFIPSACGGKGACGVCEVIVKQGGGDLLPTETGFISPGEARRGCTARLPGEGQDRHEDRGGRRRVQRAQVELPRGLATAMSPPSSRN